MSRLTIENLTSKKWFKIVFYLSLCTYVYDSITTYYFVKYHGFMDQPAVMMQIHNNTYFFIRTLFFFAFPCIYAFYKLSEKKKYYDIMIFINILLTGLSLMYAYAVLNNAIYIYHYFYR